jgi:hypothetical protein
VLEQPSSSRLWWKALGRRNIALLQSSELNRHENSDERNRVTGMNQASGFCLVDPLALTRPHAAKTYRMIRDVSEFLN